MPKSPTEAGELTPSPGHDEDLEERMDVDDGLAIKPPPIASKKEKSHKHKHKHKEHKRERSREKASSSQNKDERRERREKHSKPEKSQRDQRSYEEKPKEDRSSARDDRPPTREDRAPVRDDRPPTREDRAPVREDRAPVRDERLPIREDRAPARDDRPARDDVRSRGEWESYRTDSRGELRSLDRNPPPRDLRENLDRARMRGETDRGRDDRRYSPKEVILVRDDSDRKQPSPYDKKQLEDLSSRRRVERERKDETRRRSRSPLDDKRKDIEILSISDKKITKEASEPVKRSSSKAELKTTSLSSAKSPPRQPSGRTDKSKPILVQSDQEEEEEGSSEAAEESGSEEEEEGSEEEEEEESSSAEEGSDDEESGTEESEEEEEESSEEEAGSSSKSESDAESDDTKQRENRNGASKKDGKSKFESASETESEKEEEEEEEDDEEEIESPKPSNGTAKDGKNGPDVASDEEMAASPEMSDPPTPPPQKPPYFPALQGCRSVDDFRHLNRIEEGTYGVVFRAEDLKMKEIVALKRLKMEKEKEGFPITSLREINTLLKVQHENIVTVREIVVGSNMDKIYLVMDFVEHDLKALMETMKNPFAIGEVKTLLIQLLKAVAHMHDNWILHRDLKTSNLLLSHKGILKVGDFGLAREYGSPLKPYTSVVVTLWYRSPELLLGCKEYSTAVDMWSVGCIFAELLLMKALWPGKNEIDQINKIFKDLGTPTEKIWPTVSELPAMKKCNFTEYPYNTLKNRFASGMLDDQGYDLLNKFFTYDPKRRVSAEEAKKHKYFDTHPLPINPSLFPTWPARSEQPRGKREKTPKPPSGGAAYKLMAADDAGFHLGPNNQAGGFNLKF